MAYWVLAANVRRKWLLLMEQTLKDNLLFEMEQSQTINVALQPKSRSRPVIIWHRTVVDGAR